jgi:hypothetical protein
MKTILLILVSFVALTATFSGVLMISNPSGDLMHLPPGLLNGTFFHNYFIPGLVLAVAVGGLNIIALVVNLLRSENRYHWAIAGGSILMGFIVVQMILIRTVSWLHFLYLGIGLLIVLLAYQLEGKWAV